MECRVTSASPDWAAWRSTLAELTAIPGISGHEDAIARALADRLAPLADSVTIDALANVSARFGPAEGAPHVAVVAHSDTVGFLVKRADPAGFLRVVAVGGVNVKALPGAAVRVGEHPGVIGVRSQHLAQSGDGAPSLDDLAVEVAPALAASIPVTTPITYAPQIISLSDTLLASPYLDNRAGCAVLLALAARLHADPPPCAVTLIASAQEETTCAGAYHALAEVRPDIALFVDGTVSYDTPETQSRGAVRLGGGPVLTSFLYTSGLNGWHAHPGLRAHLAAVAAREGIAVQQDAVRGLMSDARVTLPLAIPSALIGLPMRAKHAPLETVDLRDLAAAVDLLAASIRSPWPMLTRG